MTQNQLILLGVAVLAFAILAGAATYPRWGMYLHQSEGRQ